MNQHADLALIKQVFERLLHMFDPFPETNWSPKESERVAYASYDRSNKRCILLRSLFTPATQQTIKHQKVHMVTYEAIACTCGRWGARHIAISQR